MELEFDFDAFCKEHDIILTISYNLGTKVRGFCYYDGLYYNIILNNRFSTSQLKKTTIHEILHVLHNHFTCEREHITYCEKQVHDIVVQLFPYEAQNINL